MACWSVFLSARGVRRLCMSLAFVAAAGLTVPVMAAKEDFQPVNSRKKSSAAASGSHGSAIVGSATTQTGLVSDQSVSPFLLPDSPAMLQAAADKYAAIAANGGWPSVPKGKLQKGSTGKSVAALNKRLHAEGYLRDEAVSGEFLENYTSATEAAVRHFQRNHGLAVTGAIDGPTLTQLNVPVERRLATIRANIPRVAEYSKDLGSRYAVVNVPAQQIETVEGGSVHSRHNAIVGRPSRPTPVVMTPLTIIRFNPYWNAPHSIVERDIVPRMLSSRPSKVMSDMNMKIFKGVGGPEIDPNSVNWRRAVVDHYHFRQEPGGSNAMATAKIEFNSPFGIYLHDTPEPQLFKSGQRLYSSGCVRVEGVATFIDWVLQGQDGIDRGRIAELAETKERLDTKIADAPQLRVTYLTAWPTRDGMAAFRPDIYELDGTGFVVGQPMPVGEGGPRFVLKPIPRQVAALEDEEARGFASLFRRSNPDKDGTFTGERRSKTSGNRLSSDPSTAKTTAKTTTKKTEKVATKKRRSTFDAWFKDDTMQPSTKKASAAKKKTVADKKKTVTDKKKALASIGKPDAKAKDTKAAASAKKPKKDDTKTAAAAKKPEKDDAKTAAAKTADPAKKATADKCKAGKDGKLPEGCKAPAKAAKKPAAKPEQTAAKAEEKKAAAN